MLNPSKPNIASHGEVYKLVCHGCGRTSEFSTAQPIKCECGAQLNVDWLAIHREMVGAR